jgi:hypothetical protein
MRTFFARAVLGICAATVLPGVPAVHGAEAFVDWINRVNVTVSGDTLSKTSGCNGCDDAGAVSRRAIWRDGYVEFSPGEVNTFWLAGLGHGNGGTAFEDIEFAVRFNGAGTADVMENGVYRGGDTAYRAGDMFRVAVANDRVSYFKNGQLLYESSAAPEYPLVLDASLGSLGTTVRHARIDVTDVGDGEEGFAVSRFDDLDTNRNGRIEWYEWRGSRAVFDAQDLDRNGVLTWGEVTEYGGGPAIDRIVEIDPAERWTDTGLWVSAGDTVTIDARGQVQLSTNPDDVAAPGGSRLDRRAPDAPLRSALAGTLIARIGDSTPMLIGFERSLVAPASGRLYLGINDDHLPDNSGSFTASIAVINR